MKININVEISDVGARHEPNLLERLKILFVKELEAKVSATDFIQPVDVTNPEESLTNRKYTCTVYLLTDKDMRDLLNKYERLLKACNPNPLSEEDKFEIRNIIMRTYNL